MLDAYAMCALIICFVQGLKWVCGLSASRNDTDSAAASGLAKAGGSGTAFKAAAAASAAFAAFFGVSSTTGTDVIKPPSEKKV